MSCDASQINSGPRLERTTFSRSRLLDFCSEKELVAQAGHPKSEWPLVILKEVLDNSLDACEEAGIAPEISVNVNVGPEGGPSEIVLADNGPGIPAAVVEKIKDYSIRVSSREAYVSTTRGAQGNALKCLLAMPFVLDGERGRVEIEAQNVRHDLTFRVDRIRELPVIDHPREDKPTVGTTLRIHWPADRGDREEEWENNKPRFILEHCRKRFLQIAADYAFLNPHLTLRVRWGDEEIRFERTTSAWDKWTPSMPTSACWYQPQHLGGLIAAYVTNDEAEGRVRLVREFVSEFRGLTGTAKQKQILKATGLDRAPLTELVDMEAGELRLDRITTLLEAMQKASKPVKPADLGLIGEEHLRRRVEEAGDHMEFFRYKAVKNYTKDGLPYVMETAFAPKKKAFDLDEAANNYLSRRLVTGVNWSPGINDPFRTLGGECSSLASQLHQRMCGEHEPIIIIVHWTQPRVRFTDRAKSAVDLG
jgi:DNA topoisomerase VI subunit B